MAEAKSSARAFGRSLEDFPNRSTFESELIEKARLGEPANFGNSIPITKKGAQPSVIRAGLVRFLALGGDDETPVHERGVWIQGAIIDGPLDFEGCKLLCDLCLENCELTDTTTLRDACTRSISLVGSRCQDIGADRVEVLGGLFLRNVTVPKGIVRLLGARVTGNLDCAGGHFDGIGSDGYALNCDGIYVGGNAFFRNGFVARGAINLTGATIKGQLSFVGGIFGTSPSFVAPAAEEIQALSKAILLLTNTTIEGTLWLSAKRNVSKFIGGIDLTGATIGRIADTVAGKVKPFQPDSLPNDFHETPAFLMLDGLNFTQFTESTGLDAEARIAFLRLQRASDLISDFKPHPWTQMIKVLRDSGHIEAARHVAIEFEEQRRRAGVIKTKLGQVLHAAYGKLVGYGHRPMHLMRIAAAVWLFCGALYFTASELGVMAPSNPLVFEADRYASCRPERGGNWTACDASPYEYTTFNPWIYSLDLLLPVVNLQQERDWSPMLQRPCGSSINSVIVEFCRPSLEFVNSGSNVALKPAYSIAGVFVWIVMWLEILFGWIASLLLVAVLSGLTKRMD